jgi:hypothetical protein
MSGHGRSMAPLAPLVGEWLVAPRFEGLPPIEGAPVSFAWLSGEQFIVQRWEVPVPEAPDGIAILGPDPVQEGRYLQHYFDSRGVQRVYKMTFEDGVWTVWRDEPDLSPLDFEQRYAGTLSADGARIDGTCEIRHPGRDWEVDFDLAYVRRA